MNEDEDGQVSEVSAMTTGSGTDDGPGTDDGVPPAASARQEADAGPKDYRSERGVT